jgi:hypothetical protein
MTIAKGLSTTIGVVDKAAEILSNQGVATHAGKVARLAVDTVGGIAANSLRNHGALAARIDRAGGSLTSLTGQTNILSRMFVEESVLAEPVLPHLTKSLHEWYAAQVMSALHLGQMVDGFRSVQDVMTVVQTGHNDRHTSIVGNIAARRIGQESFLENFHGDSFQSSASKLAIESMLGLEAYSTYGPNRPIDVRAERTAQREKLKNEIEDVKLIDEHRKVHDTNWSTQSVKPVKVSEGRIGPMGELFEVKLTNPNGNGNSITVPIFIQMQPTVIPDNIAPRFIDMGVPQSVWQRWTMMRAGELHWFHDFLLHRDMARRAQSMMKDPVKAKVYNDYLRTVAKKNKYAMADASDNLNAKMSSNLANSVMIFSEDTLMQAKVDSGIDLHNPDDRRRYFRNTYTMILVVVDPLHQRVTIYFNGLDGEVNSSYSDFRPNAKDFNPQEFMAAMQAFSTNNIGRMR